MLRGIEVGDMLNTVKESVLLQALQREEYEKYLTNLLNYKSAMYDPSNTNDVKLVKELLQKYEELRDPSILAERDKSVKKYSEKLKSLESLNIEDVLKNSKPKDLSNLTSFTKSKKSGEIKII